jgi:hypothetical protein
MLHPVVHAIGVIDKNDRPVTRVDQVGNFERIGGADRLPEPEFEQEFAEYLDKASHSFFCEYDCARLKRHVLFNSTLAGLNPFIITLFGCLFWCRGNFVAAVQLVGTCPAASVGRVCR